MAFSLGNRKGMVAVVFDEAADPDRFVEVKNKVQKAFEGEKTAKVYLAIDDVVSDVVEVLEPVEDNNLVKHAFRELDLLVDEDEELRLSILRAVKGFASYRGHSGGSSAIARQMLARLLQFQNLSGLTDDPEEWNHIAEEQAGEPNVWQSCRNAEAFSNDGGHTYYLLSERENGVPVQLHESRSMG